MRNLSFCTAGDAGPLQQLLHQPLHHPLQRPEQCWHLPSGRSTLQVEAYYLNMGWLLPTFHKKYWLGLNATTRASTSPAVRVAGQLQTTPATFAWLDKNAPIPYGQAYQHWGRIGSALEPNNLFGSENCGVGNASAAYALAWGWADLNCKVSAPFICKTQREQPAHCRLLAGWAISGLGCQRLFVPDA